MPKTQLDYSNTIIYKIVCNDTTIPEIYIGHTTHFCNRKYSHKLSCTNNKATNHHLKVYTFIREHGGWENWSMIQIEQYKCNNSREATMRERHWIDLLKPQLNVSNPFSSLEEKIQIKKNWYETNKDEILEKAKTNYEDNKDSKLEYQKQYAEENKEKIAEQQKEYREKNKEKLSEQKKEYRAQNKEKAAEAGKEWREANKEKIREYASQVVNCECGSQYTIVNKLRHLQTKIHTNYQNQLEINKDNNNEKEENNNEVINEVNEEIHEGTNAYNNEDKERIKQKQKEYREKRSDKIKEYKKTYNANHKDNIKVKCQDYYEEHKEQIKEKSKIYKEENKEKCKQHAAEWYQQNKERLQEKQNKLFICECGSQVKCGGKAEHLRSVKHQTFVKGST
jgi:hypothetical protein